MGTDRPVEEVRAVGLLEQDQDLILGRNAQQLIGIGVLR